MKTTSAVVISSAAEGGGSNVCEFVPSGTMPVISAQSPITFAAIDVIGATVVTTWNPDSEPDVEPDPESDPESSLPHAAATSARAAVPASTRRTEGFEDMVGTLVATWSQVQSCSKFDQIMDFEHCQALIPNAE
jgi:hypothetical protein